MSKELLLWFLPKDLCHVAYFLQLLDHWCLYECLLQEGSLVLEITDELVISSSESGALSPLPRSVDCVSVAL